MHQVRRLLYTHARRGGEGNNELNAALVPDWSKGRKCRHNLRTHTGGQAGGRDRELFQNDGGGEAGKSKRPAGGTWGRQRAFVTTVRGLVRVQGVVVRQFFGFNFSNHLVVDVNED